MNRSQPCCLGEGVMITTKAKAMSQEEPLELCWNIPLHGGEGPGEVVLAGQVMWLRLYFKCYEKPSLESFKQAIVGSDLHLQF